MKKNFPFIKKAIQLSQGSYTFTANAGESTGRFDVVYSYQIKREMLSVDTKEQDNIRIYRDENNFVIKSQNKKITGLEAYDTSGRLVYTTKANNTEVILHSEKLNNGMYILKINRGEEVTSKKIIK